MPNKDALNTPYDLTQQKFNRKFILRVESNDTVLGFGEEWHEIRSPFTVEFTITRNCLAGANTGHFVIYNLGPNLRSKIYKDAWDMGNDLAIQFFAGYAPNVTDQLPRLYNGKIRRAWSYRQRSDWRTELDCFDGAVPMDHTAITLPAGTPQEIAIRAIGSGMKGIDPKMTIGNLYSGIAKRAASYIGNPMDLLSQITKNTAFIDSGSLYALDPTEVVLGDIRVINYENGLIGTPKKAEMNVEIEMLFEPRIKPAQLVELTSLTDDRFDGVYRITGFTHRGTISGAIGGDCRTTITMQYMKDYTVIYDVNTQQYTAIKEG